MFNLGSRLVVPLESDTRSKRENRLKTSHDPKKRKTLSILRIAFAISLLLLTNCARTEFKILSVKLERKEANSVVRPKVGAKEFFSSYF